MCDKTPFPSRREANSAIKTIKRSRLDKSKRPRRAYKCEVCGQYHLTSKYTYKEEDARKRRAEKHYSESKKIRWQSKHKTV